MTNKLAVILALVIVAGVVMDDQFNHGNTLLFLLRKFAELSEWIAFWR